MNGGLNNFLKQSVSIILISTNQNWNVPNYTDVKLYINQHSKIDTGKRNLCTEKSILITKCNMSHTQATHTCAQKLFGLSYT